MSISWGAAAACVLGLACLGQAEAPFRPSPAADQALDRLNLLRKELGLEAARADTALMSSAQAHARYMELNRQPTHLQSEGKPGFFGIDPTARAQAFGYSGPVAECVGKSQRTPVEIVDQYYAAPYHRLPLIRPGAIDFGAGFAGDYSCLNFGVKGEPGTIISPADGQTGVPLTWDGIETPNPLRLHGVSGEVGFPVVVAFFGRGPGKIELEKSSLTTASGEQVAVFRNHPSNDPELRNATFLIPREPLQPRTEYIAQVSFKSPDGKMVEVTSRFTTGPARERFIFP
ncbi:MAG TPA: CAP domain-containing protein [Fimbriimonadaceae bacterium]|nr:CAP domain-containing protein [Fimbriimonadaceae bacterium]HRJ33466.1 CAP domain-containing protein [Fimbriimonadaceae bacterium]